MSTTSGRSVLVGVLALQGAFSEHIELLRKAFPAVAGDWNWQCQEIRTVDQLAACDALIIPGGESTTIALVAQRSGMLEPLRDFVKVHRKPTWGTCAGLILLAEAADQTKKGGQDLIGGLDVRVRRNHFGRQVESFETPIRLPFLDSLSASSAQQSDPFLGVFIRAPIVEKVLPLQEGSQEEEGKLPETILAPSRRVENAAFGRIVDHKVQVMATLAARNGSTQPQEETSVQDSNIVAVLQGNCFGTSFHPELTGDARIHQWWLSKVRETLEAASTAA